VVVCGAGASYFIIQGSINKTRTDLVLYTVTREQLPLTITERGQLESQHNNDIVCRLKAKSQQSNLASTIKWIIDDGSHVEFDRTEGIQSVLSWDPKEWRFVEKPENKSGLGRVVQLFVEERLKDTDPLIVKLEKTKDTDKMVYADLLVELDDSGLQDQLKTQKITVDKAESDKIQAEEQYNITVSQNRSDLEDALTKLTLAELELKKYTGWTNEQVRKALDNEPPHIVFRWPFTNIQTDVRVGPEKKVDDIPADKPAVELANIDVKLYERGDYVAALKELLGKLEMARSDLDQQVDRAAWARRMVKKGFQTASQAQAEESKEESYRLALRKVTLDLDVLVKYTRRKEETTRKRDVEEKRLALDRVKRQNAAKEVKDRTDRDTKKSTYQRELAKFNEIVDEIRKSLLYAPQTGLVVYYQDERNRWGQGRQSMIAQGEQVTEGQKLMQIPDLEHMLANTKVHEALVTRVQRGQPALVKLSSSTGKTLKGKVDSVATMAAAAEWFAGDVKVYVTKVTLDGSVEGLKPGMSAEVTITTGDPLDQVITVPIQAIVGGPELGDNRQVYVMTPKGPEMRPVVIGQSNDTKVEVKSGLEEGAVVVLNPKVLVGDKAKTRQPGEEKEQGSNGSGQPPNGKGGAGDQKGAPKQQGGQQGRGAPKGGTGAAKDAGQARGRGDWENMSEEDKKIAAAVIQDLQKATTPQERKAVLEKHISDPAKRAQWKKGLKERGVEVAD
jgi:multidrug resistance efflux pump